MTFGLPLGEAVERSETDEGNEAEMDQSTLMRIRAQTLRKSATKEERHLWFDFLKNYPVQFRRQKVIGPYIVDFFCEKAKLTIELDGSQHYEGNGPEYDRKRTEFLEQVQKLQVLRFTNLEIKQNFQGVCMEIDRVVRERFPSSVICCANATFPQGKACEEKRSRGKRKTQRRRTP